MEKRKLIERDNKEALGKYFLFKAVDFAFDKSFGKSYEFIKEGLDLLTCDCGVWRNRYKNSDKTLFNDLIITTNEQVEYYFVKGFLLSFEDNKKELYLGLDAIERYLAKSEDHYGHLVKGRILLSLGEYNIAYETFTEAMQFGSSSKLLFLLGGTKEKYLDQYGLDDLYNSFDSNPSSPCCARTLKKYMKERSLELDIPDESNALILSFEDSQDEWNFHSLYEKYLNQEYFGDEHILTLPVVKQFIKAIRANSEVFVSNYTECEDYENYQSYNSYEEHDYERDNFDALTDGQYGDYDDWKDAGGDFDFLKDGLGF